MSQTFYSNGEFPVLRRLRRGLRLTLLPLALLGCGRPATEEDCTVILRRAARLELQSRLDKSESFLQSEIRQIEEGLRGTMMEQCVGKRITESALECVKSAQTSAQLFDECLR